jgi:hypothetical protein
MKTAIAILVLFLASAAFAKKPAEPPVYDHTGRVVYEVILSVPDGEAHVVVNGQQLDAYCYVEGTSISCYDHGPSSLDVHLEGNQIRPADTTFITDHSPCFDDRHFDYATSDCQPIMALAKLVLSDPHTKLVGTDPDYPYPEAKYKTPVLLNSREFKYRLAEIKTYSGSKYKVWCTPYSLTDKKGQVHQFEGCYLND